MKQLFLSVACIAIGLAACKKNDTADAINSISYIDFIQNTEWVGVLAGSGYEYPPPCCMKFNADNTVNLYAPFWFAINGTYTAVDSLLGKITKITEMADGRIEVKASFLYLNNQTIYISNRNELVGISDDPNLPPSFQLKLFPSKGFSVLGTWRGPLLPGASGVSAQDYAYPDLNTIQFLPAGIASYSKNGTPVWFSFNFQLQNVYQQHGARVYMAGYNDDDPAHIKLMGYFGVLLPSGDSMMVHSSATGARLPNYLQTISAPYGPIGVTPIIKRQ